jgi:hypothetical protein
VHAQTPLLQSNPLAQAALQEPQLAESRVVSTQAPEQSLRPAAQLFAQAPVEQTCPVAHAVPQLPQLAVSDAKSTH